MSSPARRAWPRRIHASGASAVAEIRSQPRARPGIVRVYDLVQANGTAYIVMKLSGGRPGGAVAAPVPPRGEVEALLLPLLEDWAGSRGWILHRDISRRTSWWGASRLRDVIGFRAARAVTAGNAMADGHLHARRCGRRAVRGRQSRSVDSDIYELAATTIRRSSAARLPAPWIGYRGQACAARDARQLRGAFALECRDRHRTAVEK